MSSERKALLIVLDAARRDETHAALAASQLPALAEAATGTLIAPSCWTLPSMASVLTGLFPAEHGMTWPLTGMRCQSPTVADMLRNAGRSFRLLSGNHIYAPPVMNLPDECIGASRRQRFRGAAFLGRALGVADYGGRGILRKVRRMAADGNLPDLLILHLQETHHPYLVPPEGIAPLERARYALGHLAYYATTSAQVWEFAANADARAWAEQRTRYRRCVAWAVGIVEEVLRTYEQVGALDNTLAIITADHGEHLGEHGLADHQGSLYEELVNCPCAVIVPDLAPGSVLRGQFQHTDLLLTLCHYLGVRCAGCESGWQPLDMLAGSGGHEHAFMQWTSWGAENLAKLQRRNPSYDFAPLNRDLVAVRTDRWKYIVGSDGSETLFDLRKDRNETRDHLTERPGVVAELRSALTRWLCAVGNGGQPLPPRSPRHVSGDASITERRLRDLGYI